MADSFFREYGGSLIPWSTSCTVSKAACSHCKWTSRENVQKGLPVNVRDSRARAEWEGWRCCRGTEEEVLRLLRRQWLSWGNGGIFKTRQGRDFLWQWKEGRNRGSKGEIGGGIADACVEKQTEGTYSHLIPSHMPNARIDSVTGEVDNCWASPQNSSVASLKCGLELGPEELCEPLWKIYWSDCDSPHAKVPSVQGPQLFSDRDTCQTRTPCSSSK